MRVRFYIDGFNFYYSCFKHGRYGAYRWLDLSRFCRRLLMDEVSRPRPLGSRPRLPPDSAT